MNNIMLDLETLGQGPTAAIVSIGAVAFDQQRVSDGHFYAPIKINTAIAAGLTIDADTVRWWMRQGTQARAVFDDGAARSLVGALLDFENWLPDDAKIWGNGSDFDNVILANAYRVSGLAQPWKFWNNRCYRTLKNLYPDIKMQRSGTHHNALDDARSQAEHLIQITKQHGIML